MIRLLSLGLAAAVVFCGATHQVWAADQAFDAQTWLGDLESAFAAKDLNRLATFYDPAVTIFEGGYTNDGWTDYRDSHIGPELNEMQSPKLTHSNVRMRPLGPEALLLTADYRLVTSMEGKAIDLSGLETMVLKRAGKDWKILHDHTSSRRKPASPAP